MGHCFSCLKNQNNTDMITTPPRQKDEIMEVSSNSQMPTVMIPDYLQEEPLLHNNDNTINCYRSNSHMTSTIVLNSDNENCSGDTAQKMNSNNAKTPRSFYKKLPTITRNISSITSSDPRISESKINQLFDVYKDNCEDSILAEGIENLCNDLQLNPDDFKVLLLAWKLDASQMCRFTRAEFVQGLQDMKTDSIKGMQQRLNDISQELRRDSEQFKDLYRFTFKFGLDVSAGQRILPSDIAILLWRLVFTGNEPPILDRWLNYLERNHIRGIPKDTWYMFLNFCEFVADDLSSYDDTEAWPSLFDDFVEYENDQMNQNVTKTEMKIQD